MNGSAKEAAFFKRPAYAVEVTGWPAEHRWPADPVESPAGAKLRLWAIDPANGRRQPPPGPEGVQLTSTSFSLMNSGNRTKYASKRSWKINLKPGDDHERVGDMERLNLKSMYNDPSQMRESIAWALFAQAGVVAPRHTYARMSLNGEYLGLFSVVEEVDRRFLKHHFGDNDRGNLYKAYCGDLGCASLEHRKAPNGGDGGAAYVSHDTDDATYRLKTNKDDAAANSYDDLARLVRAINGVGLPAGAGFASDAFAAALREVFDVDAFLRWAGMNVLLGSWDNYFATPANYYLYNGGRAGHERDFVAQPYFTWIPWDYDNCLGIDYFGTRWQYADLLDWPAATRPYWAKQGRPNKVSAIPLVTNLLANHGFAQYYLDHLEYLLDTCFTPQTITARTTALWPRISPSAYMESDTPYGPPFTGRQFVNDEVYRAGCRFEELHHGEAKIDGIYHYVLMRYDSARQQLAALRGQYPAGASGAKFPVAAP